MHSFLYVTLVLGRPVGEQAANIWYAEVSDTRGGYTLGTDHYTHLRNAMAAAASGDQISIADGTYIETTTLYINQPLTLTGESESGVVIDFSTCTGYAFNVGADDVTMEYFSIAPPDQNYPIHASGTSNPPDGFDNLTLRHMTISGNHRRTGFDTHGYNHVVLSHLTSRDAYGGNGLQVTGCVDVDMDYITTSDNAWGSIAIYCSQYLNRGSDDVYIDCNTLSVGEGNVFSQDEFGYVNTNITVDGYEYIVRNETHRPEGPGFYFFQDTAADAIAFALAFTGYEQDSYIIEIATGDLLVGAGMSIQAAIDAASPGDVIQVAAGLYEERLTINKTLDLLGPQAGVDPTPAGARTNPAAEAIVDITGLSPINPNVAIEIGSSGSDDTVSGLTVKGSPTSYWADESVFRVWASNVSVADNIIDGYAGVLHKGNDQASITSNRMIVNKNGVIVQPNPATDIDATGIDRDIYYYQAFVFDAAYNYCLPAVSARDRATNYWLGDVAPRSLPSIGDGEVSTIDISALGATYGMEPGDPTWDPHCEVGPTDNSGGSGIPEPDGFIDFDDLMIFAMNYGVVTPTDVTSALFGVPLSGRIATASLSLVVEPAGAAHEEITVRVLLKDETRAVQGARFQVAFDPGVFELLSAGPMPAGEHTLAWDRTTEGGARAGAGIYFYRLETPEKRITRRMVVTN